MRGGSFHNDNTSYLYAGFCNSNDPRDQNNHIGFRVALRTDCNGNGIPDECDLTCAGPCTVYPGCGQSDDTNGDGIPDECGACCHAHGCEQVISGTCDTFGKYQGDATACEEECPSGIPAVSEWGLAAMTLLVLAAGTLVLRRPRTARA